MKRNHIESCAGALLVVCGCALVFGQTLAPWHTFAGMDFLNLLYPQAVLVQSAFAAGEMPLWNWHEWGGCPLLAAMQSAPLYPPMWAALLMPLPYALQVYIFAHLAWAGLGALRLARRLAGLGILPGAYAGIAYACGGFYLGHVEQANSVAALAWAPWIALCCVNATEFPAAQRLRACAAAACAVALALLAGHPQHVVLAVLFSEILVLLRWACGRLAPRPPGAPPPPGFPAILLLQCAMAAAAMLAAAQLLPANELGALSERIWPYTDPCDPALKWSHLPAWFIPRFYNSLANTAGQPVGYTELGLYSGIATLLLFLAGAVSWLRADRAAALPVLAVWLLALLFALGRDGLVAPVFTRLVPFLGQSRGAARALNVESLLLAMVAARGLAAVCAALRRRCHRPACHTPLPEIAACALLAADLAIVHSAELNSLLIDSRIPSIRPSVLGRLQTRGRGVYRFMANDSDYYLDHAQAAAGARVNRLQPNLNLLHETRLLDGYEEGLLPPRHYANFLRRFNRNLRNGECLDAPLLAMAGVDTVLAEYPLPSLCPPWQQAGTAPSGGRETLTLWKSGYPAAWFMDEQTLETAVSATAPPLNAYGRAGRERVPAGKDVATHRYAGLAPDVMHKAAGAAGIDVRRRRTNSMELSVGRAAATPAPVLFLQTTYPGWVFAYGSGTAQHLERVSPIFARLVLPASPNETAHSARLAFEPFSYRLGLFLSLLALSALAAMAGKPGRPATALSETPGTKTGGSAGDG